MPSFTVRGLVYCVVLQKPVDKYELVPDLMKATRHDCFLVKGGRIDDDPDPVDILMLMQQPGSDQRLLDSTYYRTRMRDWCSQEDRAVGHLHSVSQELVDMELYEVERERLQEYLNHPLVAGNVHPKYPPGWYDQCYYSP
ncbi:hypothetical protein WJX73_005484 [Symbiochloris irregularis]|uniref:Uncharacterized protein n=1 Tax=Symbiochloris irregularis TaxID=706552 RepID=A0AAW1NLT6_9CHLO